jgi:hypothetical protein
VTGRPESYARDQVRDRIGAWPEKMDGAGTASTCGRTSRLIKVSESFFRRSALAFTPTVRRSIHPRSSMVLAHAANDSPEIRKKEESVAVRGVHWLSLKTGGPKESYGPRTQSLRLRE